MSIKLGSGPLGEVRRDCWCGCALHGGVGVGSGGEEAVWGYEVWLYICRERRSDPQYLMYSNVHMYQYTQEFLLFQAKSGEVCTCTYGRSNVYSILSKHIGPILCVTV